MKITDKIHKIKESRLSPAENFLYPNFWNLEEYYSNEYPNSVFYKNNDVVLFEYDNKNSYFYCHYDKIWSVLESEYCISYQEINDLIKSMVWETLKLKGVIPCYPVSLENYQVWETLKLKGDMTYKNSILTIRKIKK